jgi:hypothetical protein
MGMDQLLTKMGVREKERRKEIERRKERERIKN